MTESTPGNPGLFVGRELLDNLSSQARKSPRLRKNYNFHTGDQDICHRLLNAMEPGSYIQPHRHLDRNKDETLVILRGKFGMILFDGEGAVTEKALLDPGGAIFMVNISQGIFHTLLSFEEGGVFFESKAGPFIPLTEAEKATWAPTEGNPSAHDYLDELGKLFLID